MTHTVVERHTHRVVTSPMEQDLWYTTLEIDITSLDTAGEETSFAAADYHSNAEGVSTAGMENPEYYVVWNRATDQLRVIDVATAGNVTQGTDVGIVDLTIVARVNN